MKQVEKYSKFSPLSDRILTGIDEIGTTIDEFEQFVCFVIEGKQTERYYRQ